MPKHTGAKCGASSPLRAVVVKQNAWVSNNGGQGLPPLHRGEASASVPQEAWPSGVDSRRQEFFTNRFPGSCLTSRLISRLNSATDTAELGRPQARRTSSMPRSSWSSVS